MSAGVSSKGVATLAVPVLGIGHRIASIGLLLVVAALMWACSDEPEPSESVTTVPASSTPSGAPATVTPAPTMAPMPATNIPFPTPQTVPASNIPFPSPTPTPAPDPAIEIMASAREKMGDAGSAAFEISANLETLSDGRTHHTPVTYVGDYQAGGYSSANVTVARSVESRVITLVTQFMLITHVFDASSQVWDVVHGYSPYFIALDELFGSKSNGVTELMLTGKEEVSGVYSYVISGKLRDLEVAGSQGDFDVTYWIGVDDGLLRQVFASGDLDLNDDEMLIGDTDAETASVKLTAKLSDHGKQVDVVTPSLGLPRFEHEAVLLDDGRVLVGGGFTGIANNNVVVPIPIELIQIYDPGTDMWSFLGPMEGLGVLYSAVKLADGRVLFVGLGIEDQTEGTTSVFDPATSSWAKLPPPRSPRGFPETFLLDDGRILVVGGWDFGGSSSVYSLDYVGAVEIVDPEAGDWHQAAPMHQIFEDRPLFLSLNDGRVMAMGAVDDGSSDPTAHAEMYDPSTDTWTVISSVEPFYLPTGAVELSDGRLLVFGELSTYRSMSSRSGKVTHVELPDGRQLNAREFAEQFPTAKIYDLAADAWTPAGEMIHSRSQGTLTLLPDGRVLAAGGEDGWSKDFLLHSTTEIFDPRTNSWSPGPDLSELRGSHSATLLPDGRVLLAGGIGMVLEIEEVYPLASSETVDPNSPGMGAPAVTSTQPPASGCEPPVGHAPVALLTLARNPPPHALLAAASEAVENVPSYRLESALYMTLEAEDGEETASIRLVIDFQAPDRVRGCLSLYDPLGGIEVPFVRIGDVVYTANPQSGEWETSESSEAPIDFLDFIGEDVISNMKEPSVDALGILNDVKVHSVTGMVTATDLGDTTLLRNFDIGGKGELEIVYWVGVDDSLVRRFVAEGMVELAGGEKVDIFMSVEVSDFGGVVVEEPRVGRASDATVR